MKRVKLECTLRIVTPAFVAGADPKASKDAIAREGVRPSSVVHGLRWWFRAIAGGQLGTSGPGYIKLRELEKELFGSTDSASPVIVQIRSPKFSASVLNHRDYSLGYLAYGLYATGENAYDRSYLEPDGSCVLRIWAHANQVPVVQALLNIWGTIGGVGARWRHGLGGIEVVEGSDRSGLPVEQRIAQRLEAAWTSVWSFIESDPNPKPVRHQWSVDELPAFPVACEPHLVVRMRDDPFETLGDALREIRNHWRRSREEAGRTTWVTMGRRSVNLTVTAASPLYHSAAFATSAPSGRVIGGMGLPVPFAVRDHGHPPPGRNYRRITGHIVPTEYERRASPIWYRVLREGDRFRVVALYWRSVYLPDPTVNKGEARTLHVKMDGRKSSSRIDYDPREADHWVRQHLASPDWTPVPLNLP